MKTLFFLFFSFFFFFHSIHSQTLRGGCGTNFNIDTQFFINAQALTVPGNQAGSIATWSEGCSRLIDNICHVIISGGNNGIPANPSSGYSGFGELRINLTDLTGWEVENAYSLFPGPPGGDNNQIGSGSFSIIQSNAIADGEELIVGTQGRIKNTGSGLFARFRYVVRPSLSSTSTEVLQINAGAFQYAQSSIVTSGRMSYKRYFFFNGDSTNSYNGLPGLRVLVMNKPFVPPYSLSFVIYPSIPIRDNCLHLFEDDDILIVGGSDGSLRIIDVSQADVSITEIDSTFVSSGDSCVAILSHPKNESVIYMLTQSNSTAIFIDREGGTYNILDENPGALGSGFNFFFTESFDSGRPGIAYAQKFLSATGWDRQLLYHLSRSDFNLYIWCLSGISDYLSPVFVGTRFNIDPGYLPLHFALDEQIPLQWHAESGGRSVRRFRFCGSGANGPGYSCDNDYNNLIEPVCCDIDTCAYFANNTACGQDFGGCIIDGTCGGNNQICSGWDYSPNGTICRNATLDCERDAVCTFGNETCPENPLDPPGTLCANSTGPCQSDSFCLENGTCPTQQFFPPTQICRNATVDCQDDAFCIYDNATCPPNPPDPPGTPCGTVFPDYLCVSSQICNSIGECIGGLPRENGTLCDADGQNCSLSECDNQGVCKVIDDELCPTPDFPSISKGIDPDNSFINDDGDDNAGWITVTVITSVTFMTFIFLILAYT